MSVVLPKAAPDAVRCPLHLPVVPRGQKLEAVIKREFAPLLGAKVVHSGRVDSLAMRFIRADPAETMFHPDGSGLDGDDRYVWVDRGDGVEYGYKSKATKALESPEKAPEVARATRKALADRMLENDLIDQPTHTAMLVELGPEPKPTPVLPNIEEAATTDE